MKTLEGAISVWPGSDTGVHFEAGLGGTYIFTVSRPDEETEHSIWVSEQEAATFCKAILKELGE